jgi:uroporphyrinogen-III synthase
MRAEVRTRSVVLTREDPKLATLLGERGASVVTLQCVRREPVDGAALRAALATLAARDVLVLTSPAGVDAVAGTIDLRAVPCPIAVIGRATGERLRLHGRIADRVASAPNGAALGRELPLPEGEVVLARSDRALADLPEALRARGARVREVIAYRTHADARGDASAARDALRSDGAAVVVTSPSALEGLVAAVGAEPVRCAVVVAIGPTTARAIERLLHVVPRVAEEPTAEAIADALWEERDVAHR